MVLKKDEEIELLISAKNGDLKSKNNLIKSNLKYVVQIAKTYQGMGIELEDLMGTPMTGKLVMAATIPGKCAAPPAPAMITFNPLLRAFLA